MLEDIEQTSVQTLAEESEKLNDEDFSCHAISVSIADCGLSAWDSETQDVSICSPQVTMESGCTGTEPPSETPPPRHSPSYSMLLPPPSHSHSRISIRSDSIHRPRYKITKASPIRGMQDSVSSIFRSDSHKRLLEAVISADLVEPPKTKTKPVRLFKSNGLSDKAEVLERGLARPGRNLLLDPASLYRKNEGMNTSVEERRSFTLSPVDPFPQGRVRRL